MNVPEGKTPIFIDDKGRVCKERDAKFYTWLGAPEWYPVSRPDREESANVVDTNLIAPSGMWDDSNSKENSDD